MYFKVHVGIGISISAGVHLKTRVGAGVTIKFRRVEMIKGFKTQNWYLGSIWGAN